MRGLNRLPFIMSVSLVGLLAMTTHDERLYMLSYELTQIGPAAIANEVEDIAMSAGLTIWRRSEEYSPNHRWVVDFDSGKYSGLRVSLYRWETGRIGIRLDDVPGNGGCSEKQETTRMLNFNEALLSRLSDKFGGVFSLQPVSEFAL
jgi:hypothetical protein